MRWKKFAIWTSVAALIAVPTILMIYIAAKPHPPTPTTRFLLNFDQQLKYDKSLTQTQRAQLQVNQQYVDHLKAEVNTVLDDYQKENPSFKQLNLHFISLNSALTPGQINFFNELNRSLLAISPKLGFTLQQPSPITVQLGYYQMNTDMVSFYWSPNYNGLGTWLQYMFSNGFAIPNLWHAVSQLIDSYNSPNPTVTAYDPTGNTAHENWVESLANAFVGNNYELIGPNNKTYSYPIVTKTGSGTNLRYHAVSPAEILLNSQKDKAQSINAYTAIDNIIASWVSTHNTTGGNIIANNNEATAGAGFAPWVYKSFQGGITGYVPSMATQLVNFMTSYMPNIPYMQNGNHTIVNQLIRYGAHTPTNPDATTTFRDWYYDPQEYANGGTLRWWNPNNPFSANLTPFNGNFNMSSAGPGIQSTFTSLYTYTTTGDYYNPTATPQYKSNFQTKLVAQGTTLPVNQFVEFINNGFSDKLPNGETLSVSGGKTANGGGYVDFPIRPIQWVNWQGKPTGHYLSPADFLAGFEAYQRSVAVNMNPNNTFMQLASVNYKETAAYKGNQAINSADTTKSFRIYFNKPELSAENILGILGNSFFDALPSFDQKVKNITDDNLFKKIAVINNGTLNLSETNMGEFYGCGNGQSPSVWQSLYYVSPYIVSQINPQSVTFSYNKYFFEPFTVDKSNPDFVQFQPNPESSNTAPSVILSNGQPVRKFSTIVMQYAGGYQRLITYEMFSKNEIDVSPIPESSVTSAYNTFPKSIYQPLISKISQSNLIPYNTNIYNQNANGNLELLYNSNNQPVSPEVYNQLKVDAYGNYVFPEGTHPFLKSNVQPSYEKLIVQNFYTPINAVNPKTGKLLPPLQRSSAIIRTAINNLINWYSLTSLASPGQSIVMQNSFMPYGVYNTNPTSTEASNPRWKYWNIAAYKVGQQNFTIFKEVDGQPYFYQRPGGIIQWSWTELIDQWKLDFVQHLNNNEK